MLFPVLWKKIVMCGLLIQLALQVGLLGSKSDLLFLLPSVHWLAFNASSLFPHDFNGKICSVFIMVKIPLRLWIKTEFKVVW